MTAKEHQRMQRLEIENRELRAALEHHRDVNRKMLYEVVELRTKLVPPNGIGKACDVRFSACRV